MNHELILEAVGIRKNLGQRLLLDLDRICVCQGERIGLIGENGAGKSTLLRILAGEEKADAGQIRIFGSYAMIRQMGGTDGPISDRLRSEFRTEEDASFLSGGEQTRRRIASAFSEEASILFADEPTTDLDAAGIELLKKYLQARKGALILVSHDRALLDLLCTRIWQLEDGKITDFPGNYSAWRNEQECRRNFMQDEYDKYRQEKARIQASIQKMAEKSQQIKKAPSRMGNSEARLHTREATNAVFRISRAKGTLQTRLDKLEKKERPRDLPDISMNFGTVTPIGARNALSCDGIRLRAGGRTLIDGGSLCVPTGGRTALLGENGCGKSTLLRLLRDEKACAEGISFTGRIRRNPAARIGLFDQDHTLALDLSKSALENAIRDAVTDESTVRTTFARLNLRGEDVFKPVGVLSGGERAKTALVKLLVSDLNVLLLDEPTNHLDVFTMEALEKLLQEYAGTILFVSHDRTFVSNVATRIVRLENAGLESFDGTLCQLEEREKADREAEQVKIEISTLQMRMAALASRMSQPKKGDDPLRLNAEYEEMALKLREIKSRM